MRAPLPLSRLTLALAEQLIGHSGNRLLGKLWGANFGRLVDSKCW